MFASSIAIYRAHVLGEHAEEVQSSGCVTPTPTPS
jgi:hypothetical protein